MTTDRPGAPRGGRCDELRDALTDVATGTADGVARAAVGEHLAACDRCREELSALSAAADEVLLLAPEQEPPADFEGRVLARIAGGSGRPVAVRRHRARRRALAVAAGACLALAGGAAVWTATAPDRELAAAYRDTLDVANGRSFAAAELVARDAGPGETPRTVGTVFVYDGDPSWAYVVVGDPGAEDSFDVVVATGPGPGVHPQRLGACTVRDGACTAGGVLDGDPHDVTAVRLEAPDGSTWASTGRPEGWTHGW